ncbi:CRISPR-associated endonuclease Cas1 1 [candidate division SR1 bacterium]|nr:CRISPR-associated endonuclease Cas1 1 [candidate division SR1 bacterium]
MLSRPDFIEKQIVVISSDRIKDLSFRNDNLLIKVDGKIKDQISLFKIFCVFIVGECTLSTRLIREFLTHGIAVFCFQMNLKPLASIGSPLAGNYLLREKQYFSTSEQDLQIAKHIIANKVSNQLFLLQSLRTKGEKEHQIIDQVKEIQKKIKNADTDDSLRGLEGSASKLFFSSYFRQLGRYKREPRTRCDWTNLLMDMGYSLLYNFIEANLNLYGFDVYRGVFHKLFFERKSLACDLVEPFRCLIDKTILKAFNLNQINQKDFSFRNGEYELDMARYQHYLSLFLRIILEHKMDFFDYIKQYYYFIMGKEGAEMPTFILNQKE